MSGINKKVDVNPKDIDLNTLRGLMKRGDNQKIAEMTGYTSVYVSQVLNTKRPEAYNGEIIKAAVNMVQGRMIKMDSSVAEMFTNKSGNSVPNRSDE